MPTFASGYVSTSQILDSAVTTAKIANGAIINEDVKSDAGIDYSKLATLTGDVTITANVSAIGSGKVTEAMQVLADNTTNDVSTSKHGYVPKAPNVATQFLNGTGAFSTPASGKSVTAEVATWTSNFTSTSDPTFVDVTNATVTITGLNSGLTYDLIAVSSFYATGPASGSQLIKLLIDGTEVCYTQLTDTGGVHSCALSGMKSSVTGATSYIAKLTACKSGGGGSVNINQSSAVQSITIMAIEV